MPFDPFESSAADEQDILGVDVDELLLRMLAASLRRYVYHVAFQELEHGLLDAFTRYVTGY